MSQHDVPEAADWGTAEDWRTYLKRERDNYLANLRRVQEHLKYAIAERDAARAELARVAALREAALDTVTLWRDDHAYGTRAMDAQIDKLAAALAQQEAT